MEQSGQNADSDAVCWECPMYTRSWLIFTSPTFPRAPAAPPSAPLPGLAMGFTRPDRTAALFLTLTALRGAGAVQW